MFDLNKAGVPNTRGGRKKSNRSEPWDTSNQDLPGYTEEEILRNPELRKSHEERIAAGIPVGGIKARGFSKKANKRTEVTLTGIPTVAPSENALSRFLEEMNRRTTDREIDNIESNTEAERLRDIEAKKQRTSENRNAAFKIDWNDVPRS